MAKNYAIVIGINKYDRFKHLKYAKRDAEKMRDFFKDVAKFDEVHFFSDDSPDIILKNGRSTSSLPSVGNLHSYLDEWFDESFLNLAEGDNFWFFFAGHGFEINNKDYLAMIDGNTSTTTGIEVNYICERLINCGSANVILILDACRSGGNDTSTGARGNESGIGNQEQQGVFTIYACSKKKTSYEIDELEHGVFTYALLEGLKLCKGNRSLTAKELEEYLQSRVSKLCSKYEKPKQVPCIAAPVSIGQSNVIFLPQIPEYYQKIAEVSAKKERASWLANEEGKLKEALEICRELDILTKGSDEQVTKMIAKIERKIGERSKVRLKVRIVNLCQSILNIGQTRNRNNFLQNFFLSQFFLLPFGAVVVAILTYQIASENIKIPFVNYSKNVGNLPAGTSNIEPKPTTIADLCSSYVNNSYISCKNETWDEKIAGNNQLVRDGIANGNLTDSQVHVIAVVVPGDNSSPFISKHILQGIADKQKKFNNEFNGKSSNSWKIFVLIARESKNGSDKNQNEIANGGSPRADELVKQSRILGVIGPYSSPSLVNVVNKYCNKNLTLLSPTVSIPREDLKLKFEQYYKNVILNAECFFRTTGTNENASLRLLNYLNDNGYKNVLILKNENDAFADSFWISFKREKEKFSGLSFPENIASLSKKQQIKSKIEQWKNDYNLVADKTAILMIKGPKKNIDNTIAMEVVKNNDGKFLIIASNPVYQPTLLENLQYGNSPKVIKKMIIAVPWFPNEKDSSKLGKPISDLDSFYAMSYDATEVLIQAISQEASVKQPTREGVRSQFNNLKKMEGATDKITLTNGDRVEENYKLIQPNCQDNKNCEWVAF